MNIVSAEMKRLLGKARRFWWLALLPLLVGLWLAGSSGKEEQPIDNYSQLVSAIEKGDVESITLDPNNDTVQAKDGEGEVSVVGVPATGPGGFSKIIRQAQKANVEVSSEPLKGGSFKQNLIRALPTLLLLGLIGAALAWQTGILNRVSAHPKKTGVGFDDVAGCDEAIEELEDVRSFLQDPNRFEVLGARVPKGVLLYGPPGTGKTLLAQAVADEAGIPFFSASGSEFVEMFAGLGAKRVRQLFQAAKKSAPSIIFIDELDAVGGHRTSGGDGGSREADQTLVQILKEMDGFEVSSHPVIVIAATNRVDHLDRALVRPGRFDRHIAIDPPDRFGRRQILAVHSRGKPLGDDVDLDSLAIQTSGMTGADLALILNEAALIASRRGAGEISAHDIDDAFFRIVAGAKKQNRALSEKERQTIAVHECGHALVGERLPGSSRLHKVSVIPRGSSGGQTLYVSSEDVFLESREGLLEKISGLLAGRAAEEVVFGTISSGAADDLRRASDIALAMVCELGMSERVGLRSLAGSGGRSPAMARMIDEEVGEILDRQYAQALEIVREEKAAIERLSAALLVEETIDRERFLEVLGEK